MPLSMRRKIKRNYIRERFDMFHNFQTLAASQIEVHEDVLAVDAQGRIRGEDDPFDMETEAWVGACGGGRILRSRCIFEPITSTS